MTRADVLAGRTVIVTGAGAGIGRGVAQAAARNGASVVLADISPDPIKELAEDLEASGHEAVAAQTDVTAYDEVDRLVQDTVERFGRLDGLVTAAGGFPGRVDAEQIGIEEWEHGIRLNLTSAFFCCRAAIPHLKGQGHGSIVLVSSAAGRTIVNQCTAYYAAAKSGMLGLVHHLAYELGEHGIRVNAVAPGTTLTPRIEQLYDDERLQGIRDKTPLRRIADVDDQVGPIMFLLSDDSRYMTGATLDVNGGRIMM